MTISGSWMSGCNQASSEQQSQKMCTEAITKFRPNVLESSINHDNLLLKNLVEFLRTTKKGLEIRAVPNSTIGGQINTTFLVEFLLNCGIRGRW